MTGLIEIKTTEGDVIVVPVSTLREIRKDIAHPDDGWVVTLEPVKGVKTVHLEVEFGQKEAICLAWAEWLGMSHE